MRIVCATLLTALLLTGSVQAQGKEDALKAAATLQAEVMRRIQAKFDLNGDGTVDDAEKTKVTDKIKADLASGKIPADMQELLDRNGNKKLDAEEAAAFRELIARMQAGGGGPQFGGGGGFGGPGNSSGFGGQVPPEVLKKFDKNKNGQLDEDEQKAAMAALGPKKSRKEQLLEKLDLNGDGKITADEREQVAAQRKAEQEEKKAKKKKDSDK